MTNPEIDAFLAICKHKNISKAAGELYISQSSLSARLKALEKELGCTLILRHKGGREITLTRRGQSFQTLALRHQELEAQMKNIGRDDITDELKISVLDSLGNYMFTRVFEVFSKENPNIQLTLQDMEAEMASISISYGKTDLAFSNANIQTERIQSTPLLAEPYTIITSARSVFPERAALEELPKDREVYTSWSYAFKYWHRDVFGADYLPHVELDLMGQFRLFAAEPGFWAIVPVSMAKVFAADGALKIVEPGFGIPDRVIYVLQDRDRTKSPNTLRFLETVRRVLGETMPEVRLL